MYKNYKTPCIISSSNLHGIAPLASLLKQVTSMNQAMQTIQGTPFTGPSLALGKRAHISELSQRQLLPILKEEF